MKTRIFFFIFSLSLCTTLYAQDLSRYKYVQVPQKFDFLKEENKYQLNALTAFLLEKYGFEALYEEEMPAALGRCDVLDVEVHNKSGLFSSRLFVTLEDCNDNVVFTSQVGSSRIKDFEKSYHEALREAFASFEALRKNTEEGIDPASENTIAATKAQPAEVVVDPVPLPAEKQDKVKASEVIIDPVLTSSKTMTAAKKDAAAKVLKPSEGRSANAFTNGATLYFLKETPVGFELFRDGVKEKFGTLLRSSKGDSFLYSSKNVSGSAFFDTQGNLVVEYLDPTTEQLVNVIYKRND